MRYRASMKTVVAFAMVFALGCAKDKGKSEDKPKAAPTGTVGSDGMRTQGVGCIVAVGSKAAVEPAPFAGVYAASKAALVSLIRTVARENAEQHISANVVLPGTMDTSANRASSPLADYTKWVDPKQVAKLVVHLASDEASQINGAVIPVYGGEA